jgi:hypothetical protein
MKFERQIVDYVSDTAFEDIPAKAVEAVKTMLLADIGTTIAGAKSDGCLELNEFFKSQGGKPEASILLHGGSLPAQNAVFVNVPGAGFLRCHCTWPTHRFINHTYRIGMRGTRGWLQRPGVPCGFDRGCRSGGAHEPE